MSYGDHLKATDELFEVELSYSQTSNCKVIFGSMKVGIVTPAAGALLCGNLFAKQTLNAMILAAKVSNG